MEIESLYRLFRECTGVNTDTRTLEAGQMFIALKGENFDGNTYALKAIEGGARYAVVNADSEAAQSGHPQIVVVEDTQEALTCLGRYHREQVLGEGRHLPVIGLTGTNGKTTTKELIYRVLSTKYKVCATQGNLNNDIGVPLSLLQITPDTDIAVIEMGASHPDDIEKLVQVSEPDYGLITNVGKAHLLGFGSFEGVCAAKGKLYDYLLTQGGHIFYNADDAVLLSMLKDRGLEPGNTPEGENQSGAAVLQPYGIHYWHSEILPTDAHCPFLRMTLPLAPVLGQQTEEEMLVETHLVGSYNANNVAAALAVGIHFGVQPAEALLAIARFEPANNRSQMVHTASNTLIVDAYNANPTSMNAALDNFELMEDDQKVILLGNMGELGEDSQKEHIALLRRLIAMKVGLIALVGSEFEQALQTVGRTKGEGRLLYFPTSVLLAEYLAENPLKKSLILIKGSRSTAMEKVIPVL